MSCGMDLPGKDDLPDKSDIPKADEIPVDFKVDGPTVRSVLKALFPDLSDEEIVSLEGKLSLSAVLELKVEIEDIRSVASKLGKELTDLAESAVRVRENKLADHNAGYPTQLTPLGLAAYYDRTQREARIDLSAVFEGQSVVLLSQADVSAAVQGTLQPGALSCAHSGDAVDIVLLVDITGSMSPVIRAVRNSLLSFVDRVVASGVRGTLSVVTFQDSVGVNVSFQEPRSKGGYERSPFMANVAIDVPAAVESLKRFLGRLEAGSGADRPENLAAALDYANSNLVGLDSKKRPNVIGDGIEDPMGVSPFPGLGSKRRVFAAFTDATFHSDSRTPNTSSLLAPFKPRPIADILRDLHARGTTVHVSDPSWVDETVAPTGAASEVEVDSDYWAIRTGGLGQDRVVGYALNDLEQLIFSRDTGLLDVVLDRTVSSSCSYRFPIAELSASSQIELVIQRGAARFAATLTPTLL